MANSGQNFIPAHYNTFSAFNNDNTVADNQVSWLEDVRQIYVGRSLYSGAATILGTAENFPAQPSALVGVLYCKPSTMEIRRYTTTGFDVITRPISTTINSSSTHDQLPTAQATWSAIGSAIAPKMDKLATGSAGFVVQTNATGGVQYSSLPLSRVADTNMYGNAVSSGSFANGALTLYRINGGSQVLDLGIDGLFTSAYFNSDTAVLTIYTTAGDVQSQTDVDLTALLDVYTGDGRREFRDGFASKVAVKEYYGGMSVAVGDIVHTNTSYLKMNAAGSLLIGAEGPNLAYTVLSVITNLSLPAQTGAYFELDGVLWLVVQGVMGGTTYNDNTLVAMAEVSVKDYQITAHLNLAPEGHLYNHASGLAVSAAAIVDNNENIVTGGAIVTYVDNAKTQAIASAKTYTDTAKTQAIASATLKWK